MEMALSSFSFYSNARRVFRTSTKREEIRSINGIRVLSFGWIVLGHTYMLGIVVSEVSATANLLTVAPQFIRSWSFQPILNFHFNSDTFLVIR